MKRSIIFYFAGLKQEAIYLAKKINGYVDVEDGEKANPHIDMDPFQNVMFIAKTENSDLDAVWQRYQMFWPEKKKYFFFKEPVVFSRDGQYCLWDFEQGSQYINDHTENWEK